jgi:hypothetical protein
VAHAAGVAAADVRKALPSWKLTACYRDALVKASKPLEGHVTLTLTIDGSGAISRAGARGVGSLLQATGDCMMNALVGVAVANVSEPGGTAEVDVACSPR